MTLNLSVDEVLTTTRSVRKRLDFDKPVPRDVLMECLELALQAPTGSNSQGWQWVFVEDAAKKKAIADVYLANARGYLSGPAPEYPDGDTRGERMGRVRDSATYLAEHMHRAPVLLIPCLKGREDESAVGGVSFGPHCSRRCGASAWRCAPAGWVRAGRRCTCSTTASTRWPTCSAFPTTNTAKAGCFRSPTHKASTSGRPSGCRPRA